MAKGFRILVLAGLVLSIAAASSARADVVTVTSGNATVAWDDPPFFNLHGAGFELFSGFFAVPLSPQEACFAGCAPGTRVSLTTVMGGAAEDSLGQAQAAVVGAVTYATPGNPDSWLRLSGELFFDSSTVIVPPLTPGGDIPALFLSAPFMFHGQVEGAPQNQAGGEPLFRVNLVGSGTARLRLINAGDLWRFPEVHFTFEDSAPVPEPGSVVLVMSGLAGLLARSRQRRRRAASARHADL